MKPTQLVLAFFVLLAPTAAAGAGLAHNENFIVMAQDDELAHHVLVRADRFRKELATEWLGGELPPSVGRTIINVELSDDVDQGFTWPIDVAKRKCHQMWLRTSRQRAAGSTLEHEITHVVLATRFRNSIPCWADEGAASLADDPQRTESRRRTIDWYQETGSWPDLQTVLNSESISASDQATYSVAASVSQYLIAQRGKRTFLAFAVSGKQNGWDRALQAHYGISSVRSLQSAWQAWVSRRSDRLAAVSR